MVDRGLIEYIRNSLRQGYGPDAIRNYLLSQGYAAADIDAALGAAYGRQPDKKKFFTLVIVVIVFLAVAGAGIYVVSSSKDSPGTVPLVTTPGSSGNAGAAPVTPPVRTQPKEPVQEPVRQSPASTAPKDSLSKDTAVQEPVVSAPDTSSTENDILRLMKNVRSVNDCSSLGKNKDKCILEFSWQKDHIGFCEEISSDKVKDTCISRHALRHEERDTCQKILDRYDRQLCDVLLRTAKVLREQGTQFTLDPLKGEIQYNLKDAVDTVTDVRGPPTEVPPEAFGIRNNETNSSS